MADSATLMTWLNFASRYLGVTILLPLVLRYLSAPEIAFYLAVSSLIALQNALASGFSPSFVRLFGYAMSGASEIPRGRFMLPATATPASALTANYGLLGQLIRALDFYWAILALGTLGVLALGGWFFITPLAAALPYESEALTVFVGVAAASVLTFYGRRFSVFLQGTNHVSLTNRWQALANLFAFGTAIAVLLSGGGLLWLLASQAFWQLFSALRDRYLAHRVLDGWLSKQRREVSSRSPLSRDLLARTWQPSWRAALGAGVALGTFHLSGLIFTRLAPAAEVATILLAMRLIDLCRESSLAPFYSKIPLFSQLYASGQRERLRPLLRRAIRLSLGTYLAACLALSLLGPLALPLLGAEVAFPPLLFWALLALGFGAERLGALHLQTYTLTNHVVWHRANGITGLLYLATLFLSLPALGYYGVALAALVANIGFYMPYGMRLSDKALS